MADGPTCSFPGCGRKRIARGLCHGHYKQLTVYKTGLRPLHPRWKGAICSVSGCGRPVRCRGYCNYHHKAALAGAEMKLPENSMSVTKFERGMQVCTKCKRALPRDSFWADKRIARGTQPRCKDCMGARYKGWVKKNPDARKKTTREWFGRNKDKTSMWHREYRAANKDRLNAASRAYLKRRRETDPAFRAKASLRARLIQALNGATKSVKTMELVGCTLPELKAHLESLFTPGMSWDNYGRWNIDHIMPCAMFDLLDPKQQRECFHYTNLQPLWARDNVRKSDKSPEEWAKISGGSAR